MRVQDIEIPYEKDRSRRYRFFERLPGILTWSIFILPFVISFFAPHVFVFIIIVYILLWFVKSMAMLLRNVQGLHNLERFKKLDWQGLLADLESGEVADAASAPDWHQAYVQRERALKPSDVLHAVIIAAYNETREILEPTVQSLIDSNYDLSKVMLVFAYEGRDGAQAKKPVLEMVKEYGSQFKVALAYEHPFNPKEVRGKGGNITFAAREFEK